MSQARRQQKKGFAEEEFQYSKSHTPEICTRLADAFGLDIGDVDNLEMEDSGKALEQDYDGIDAVIQFPSNDETVGIRCRPDSDQWDVDFSLRTEGRLGGASEWDKFKSEYNGDDVDGEIPTYYVFARTRDGNITECYLLRTEWLIDYIWGDNEDPEEQYPERGSDGGGSARYIPMENLERAVVTEL